ncbi:MAG: hypothetical protein ACRDJ4_09465 [Actinomycetota bacterium]
MARGAGGAAARAKKTAAIVNVAAAVLVPVLVATPSAGKRGGRW